MSLSRHILKKPFTSLASCAGKSCEAAPSTVQGQVCVLQRASSEGICPHTDRVAVPLQFPVDMLVGVFDLASNHGGG